MHINPETTEHSSLAHGPRRRSGQSYNQSRVASIAWKRLNYIFHYCRSCRNTFSSQKLIFILVIFSFNKDRSSLAAPTRHILFLRGIFKATKRKKANQNPSSKRIEIIPLIQTNVTKHFNIWNFFFQMFKCFITFVSF